MAETLNPRTGTRNWGASTDGPSRVEFNGNFDNLELLTAIDKQNTLANRPAAGVRGTYFYATDNGVLYRDTGSAWTVVGARSVDEVVNASGTGAVPLTVNGANGATADLFKAQVNGTDLARIDKDGDVFGASYTGAYAALTGTVAGQVVLAAKGASGQTADLLSVQNNASANMFRVSAAGGLGSPLLATAANSSVIGASSATTPASMSLFNAPPIFEVYSSRNAAGAFNDFAYIHHQAADNTAVTRRLGLLFQIGDASGDAAKSGGIGIESTAANAANPDLILFRGDSTIARFKSDGTSALTTTPTISGTVTISQALSLIMGSTRIGTQGGSFADMYLRVGNSNNLYVYAGGGHSDTGGDAGGGTRIAQISKSGSIGRITTGALRATNFGEVNPVGKDLALAIGDESAIHLGFCGNAIQGYVNPTTGNTLYLNPYGGDVNAGQLGKLYSNQLYIGGKRVTIASSSPSSPAVGDVWIQIP